MSAYTNGRIPDSALATIPGGGRLLAAVAVTWLAICAEVYRLHGWTPAPTGPLDAYRPYDGNYYAQVETFLRRYERRASGAGPFGDVRFWNGVRYVRVNGDAAAVPGQSNHGWACAVDVTGLGGFGSTRYRQFAAVAARYGWTNTEGSRIGEPWHWVDVGNAHLVANGLTDLGVLPDLPSVTNPEPPKGPDMAWTEAEWVRLDRIILDRVVALVNQARTDVLARVDQHAENARRARRPLFIRCKDGRIVADVGSGYRAVTAEQWQVWTNLGRASIDPDLSAMDPVPFQMLVDSLGGLKTPTA